MRPASRTSSGPTSARRPARIGAWPAGTFLLAAVILPRPSTAHPALGDLVQHRISIAADTRNIDITIELVFADLRAMAERRRMDRDHDWTVTGDEARAYAAAMADALLDQLQLTIDGEELPLVTLHDPAVDLLGMARVGPLSHVLKLFLFVRTPPDLRCGSELILTDRLWLSAPALCTLSAAHTGEVRFRPRAADALSPGMDAPAARVFDAVCIVAPSAREVMDRDGQAASLLPSMTGPPEADPAPPANRSLNVVSMPPARPPSRWLILAALAGMVWLVARRRLRKAPGTCLRHP